MGRRTDNAVGIRLEPITKESARHGSDAPTQKRLFRYYFLVGAGDAGGAGGGTFGEPCGTGTFGEP
jgi:hypothetical protein